MYDEDPYDRSAIISKGVGCRNETNVGTVKPQCPYHTFRTNVDAEVAKLHQAELECLQSKSTEEIAKVV